MEGAPCRRPSLATASHELADIPRYGTTHTLIDPEQKAPSSLRVGGISAHLEGTLVPTVSPSIKLEQRGCDVITLEQAHVFHMTPQLPPYVITRSVRF